MQFWMHNRDVTHNVDIFDGKQIRYFEVSFGLNYSGQHRQSEHPSVGANLSIWKLQL